MAYGIGGPLFLGSSPAIHAERAQFARSSRSARAWRALSEQSRLELIEKALENAANDDEPVNLPVAL
ncbi:MAG TPA: hypothetical protein VFZ35_05855 [Sphingomicrobium sp.]